MLFQVKCIRCGRIAIVKSVEPELSESADGEPPGTHSRLGGYIIKCPACGEQKQPQNPGTRGDTGGPNLTGDTPPAPRMTRQNYLQCCRSNVAS
jgi:hypothetical protein